MARLNKQDNSAHKSFCRICTGHCGVLASVDDKGRLTAIKGDNEDPQTLGFICSKGTDAVDSHNSEHRILQPLKRQPDGSFKAISREQALSEIAAKMGHIIDKGGPNAVAAYRGSGGFFASASMQLVNAWMDAIGSHQMYSNLTIDQSAKWVTLGRLGYWPPGVQQFSDSDVCMLIGNNPLVSVAGSGFDTRHPLKRIRAAKARGMKIIVIDPRRTETAQYADVFVQPLPGNDAAIVAAIIGIILSEGWHDAAFCQQHVADLPLLKNAVEPFSPEAVAQMADVPVDILWDAARTFARDSNRGVVTTATGPSMSPFSNTTEQMVGCLNVICGRYVREGESIHNPGLILGWQPKPAQVVDIGRSWEQGPKSRLGNYGTIGGEMLTPLLADEILLPGDGQIKCLLSIGGNPAAAIPDQEKIIKALESLELLVSLEPFMTATAMLSDYILPPRMPYEREDLHLALFETAIYDEPYARYTKPIATPPENSELCDEWYLLWSLASKMGVSLTCNGVTLNMEEAPTANQLLEILAINAPVSWDKIKNSPQGYTHNETLYALPADSNTASRFTTMPKDVQEEMAALREHLESAKSLDNNGEYNYLMTSRRSRHRFNTVGHFSPYLKKLLPYNPAFLSPLACTSLGVKDGDWVEIKSDRGAIKARVQVDPDLRGGVVSITHCFGKLPGQDDDESSGVSTNLLISTDRDLQTINAMPRMSGIPVAIKAINQAMYH